VTQTVIAQISTRGRIIGPEPLRAVGTFIRVAIRSGCSGDGSDNTREDLGLGRLAAITSGTVVGTIGRHSPSPRSRPTYNRVSL
jgi:hypothetical protein